MSEQDYVRAMALGMEKAADVIRGAISGEIGRDARNAMLLKLLETEIRTLAAKTRALVSEPQGGVQ